MTKKTTTLKALRENLGIDQKAQGLGPADNLADPASIRNLNKFANQITKAVQPDIPILLVDIEKELRKYGFTLGPLEEYETDGNGAEDFVVLRYPDMQEIHNFFISLKWEKVGPEDSKYRSEKLCYIVDLSVNSITTNEYKSFFNTDTVHGKDDDQSFREEAEEVAENRIELEEDKVTIVLGEETLTLEADQFEEFVESYIEQSKAE